MSALPEKYRKYAAPHGQHPVQPREVALYDEQDPIVWVPSAEDPRRSVAVRRSSLQPMARPEPRDLTPLPLLDPIAARMLCGGIGGGTLGAGVGWGAAQILDAVAGAGAGLLVFALLLLAARLGGGRTVVTVRQEVHNHATWFGRNDTFM